MFLRKGQDAQDYFVQKQSDKEDKMIETSERQNFSAFVQYLVKLNGVGKKKDWGEVEMEEKEEKALLNFKTDYPNYSRDH